MAHFELPERLAALDLNLPGADEKLSQQIIHLIPVTFTLFQKLPTKVPLKIWRDTFPNGRYVQLCFHKDRKFKNPRRTKGILGPFTLAFGRTEALKHYYIFFPSDGCNPLTTDSHTEKLSIFAYTQLSISFRLISTTSTQMRSGASYPLWLPIVRNASKPSIISKWWESFLVIPSSTSTSIQKQSSLLFSSTTLRRLSCGVPGMSILNRHLLGT